MENIQLSKRIKLLCKVRNITVKKMLTDIEKSRNFIYDLEHKETKPSIETIEEIANYLNVSIDYLVGRTDNPEINK